MSEVKLQNCADLKEVVINYICSSRIFYLMHVEQSISVNFTSTQSEATSQCCCVSVH